MQSLKVELMQKMEAKGMSVSQAAEAMGFDPIVLSLYLVNDAYPVPQRILDKLAAAISA